MRRMDRIRGVLVGAAVAVGLVGARDASAAGPSRGAASAAPSQIAAGPDARATIAGRYVITAGASCSAHVRLLPNGTLTLTQPDGAISQGTWAATAAVRGGTVYSFDVTHVHRHRDGRVVAHTRSHGTFTYDTARKSLDGHATHEHQDSKRAVLLTQSAPLAARSE